VSVKRKKAEETLKNIGNFAFHVEKWDVIIASRERLNACYY